MLITLQYLEDSPELLSLSPQQAGEKLKLAFDALPVTHLLIGWHLPDPLLETCSKMSEMAGVKFFRWHPLLTGDGSFEPRPDWQVVGSKGDRIPGFQNMPEFTFVCPNHPDASGKILDHLTQVAGSGFYSGLFLDRIRWPSPAGHPFQQLGCFCEYCREAAGKEGIDLDGIQNQISVLSNSRNGKINLIRALLGHNIAEQKSASMDQIEEWLTFRENSITLFSKKVAGLARTNHLEIGLDCFSPGLTRMVGQNIPALSSSAEWIKMMCYAHTLGPAGLPFELMGLFDFLTKEAGLTPRESMNLLSSSLQVPLPDNRDQLQTVGLSSEALALEVRKGVKSARIPILAGLELVDIPGVSVLQDDIILSDHLAVKTSAVAGLSISWDLLHIPEYRLNLISSVWLD